MSLQLCCVRILKSWGFTLSKLVFALRYGWGCFKNAYAKGSDRNLLNMYLSDKDFPTEADVNEVGGLMKQYFDRIVQARR